MYEAHGHGDYLPDDWRYETIRAAIGWLADNEPEDGHEFADGNVDTYTGSRYAWLASNLRRAGYCDQAQEEGLAEGADVTQLVGLGQYMESLEVFESVRQSLEDRLAEVEAES